ncbi:hypothetical protein [Herbaspirillum rubrisubalbicans]|uniref:hypothetical protein n=1 Tax=Herbaspirillum rubrisubalbicans TaxID=80842 RepID=UPI0012F64655|nr:hypothetical protein [Herbaspirillum rubrisubalbicans]
MSLEDIGVFCALSDLPMDVRLNNCALELAKAYADGGVNFAVGDEVANVLFGYAAQQGAISDFLFDVFLAFDAGEFYPDSMTRSPSPEERFTRSGIATILKKYDGR